MKYIELSPSPSATIDEIGRSLVKVSKTVEGCAYAIAGDVDSSFVTHLILIAANLDEIGASIAQNQVGEPQLSE